jgi:hypothetical protein
MAVRTPASPYFFSEASIAALTSAVERTPDLRVDI